MSVIFMESFDGVANTDQLMGPAANSPTTKWFEYTTGGAMTTSTFWSIVSSKLKALNGSGGQNCTRNLGTTYTTIVFGIKWTPTTISATKRAVIALGSSALNSGKGIFLAQHDGELQLGRASVTPSFAGTVTSSGLGLVTGTEYAIEIKAQLTSGTTWSVEVRVNGTVALTDPGNDYGISSIQHLICADWASLLTAPLNDTYDHAYADDAAYALGGGSWQVQCIRPDGAGAHTDWVPDSGSNYARVNEQNVDDASYVQATFDNDEDTYTYDNPTHIASHAVRAVQVNSRAAYLSGAKNLAHVQRNGGGTEADGANKALAAALSYVGTVFNTQADGSAWGSFNDLDSYQWGRKQKA